MSDGGTAAFIFSTNLPQVVQQITQGLGQVGAALATASAKTTKAGGQVAGPGTASGAAIERRLTAIGQSAATQLERVAARYEAAAKRGDAGLERLGGVTFRSQAEGILRDMTTKFATEARAFGDKFKVPDATLQQAIRTGAGQLAVGLQQMFGEVRQRVAASFKEAGVPVGRYLGSGGFDVGSAARAAGVPRAEFREATRGGLGPGQTPADLRARLEGERASFAHLQAANQATAAAQATASAQQQQAAAVKAATQRQQSATAQQAFTDQAVKEAFSRMGTGADRVVGNLDFFSRSLDVFRNIPTGQFFRRMEDVDEKGQKTGEVFYEPVPHLRDPKTGELSEEHLRLQAQYGEVVKDRVKASVAALEASDKEALKNQKAQQDADKQEAQRIRNLQRGSVALEQAQTTAQQKAIQKHGRLQTLAQQEELGRQVGQRLLTGQARPVPGAAGVVFDDVLGKLVRIVGDKARPLDPNISMRASDAQALARVQAAAAAAEKKAQEAAAKEAKKAAAAAAGGDGGGGGGGLGTAFLGGLFGRGFGQADGVPDLRGFVATIGSQIKYIVLAQAIFGVQKALVDTWQETLKYEEAQTDLQIALGRSTDLSNTFEASLRGVARIAGTNVSEAMDVATRGIRTFSEQGAADAQIVGERFTEAAGRLAVIANVDLKASGDQLVAIASAFDLGDTTAELETVVEAIAEAKNLGAVPAEILSSVSSSGVALAEAGLSVRESALVTSAIIAKTNQSAVTVGTRLSRLVNIVRGAGQDIFRNLDIDTNQEVSDQLAELAAIFPTLGAAEQRSISSQLASVNIREFTVLLDAFSEGSNYQREFARAQDEGGQATLEYARRIDNLASLVRRLGGDLTAIQNAVAQSGLFDAVGITLELAEPFLRVFGQVLNLVNDLTDAIPGLQPLIGILVALNAAAALHTLIASRGGLAAIFGGVGGKLATTVGIPGRVADTAVTAANTVATTANTAATTANTGAEAANAMATAVSTEAKAAEIAARALLTEIAQGEAAAIYGVTEAENANAAASGRGGFRRAVGRQAGRLKGLGAALVSPTGLAIGAAVIGAVALSEAQDFLQAMEHASEQISDGISSLSTSVAESGVFGSEQIQAAVDQIRNGIVEQQEALDSGFGTFGRGLIGIVRFAASPFLEPDVPESPAGESFFDQVRDAVEGFGDVFGDIGDFIGGLFDAIGPVLQGAPERGRQAVDAYVEYSARIAEQVAETEEFFADLAESSTDFGLITGAEDITRGVQRLKQAGETATETLTELIESFRDAVSEPGGVGVIRPGEFTTVARGLGLAGATVMRDAIVEALAVSGQELDTAGRAEAGRLSLDTLVAEALSFNFTHFATLLGIDPLEGGTLTSEQIEAYAVEGAGILVDHIVTGLVEAGVDVSSDFVVQLITSLRAGLEEQLRALTTVEAVLLTQTAANQLLNDTFALASGYERVADLQGRGRGAGLSEAVDAAQAAIAVVRGAGFDVNEDFLLRLVELERAEEDYVNERLDAVSELAEARTPEEDVIGRQLREMERIQRALSTARSRNDPIGVAEALADQARLQDEILDAELDRRIAEMTQLLDPRDETGQVAADLRAALTRVANTVKYDEMGNLTNAWIDAQSEVIQLVEEQVDLLRSVAQAARRSTIDPRDVTSASANAIDEITENLANALFGQEEYWDLIGQLNEATLDHARNLQDVANARNIQEVDPRNTVGRVIAELENARADLALMLPDQAEFFEQLDKIVELELELAQTVQDEANAIAVSQLDVRDEVGAATQAVADAAVRLALELPDTQGYAEALTAWKEATQSLAELLLATGIAAAEATVFPGDEVAAAAVALLAAELTLEATLEGTQDYWEALSAVLEAEVALAHAVNDAESVLRQLWGDVTNPIFDAEEAVTGLENLLEDLKALGATANVLAEIQLQIEEAVAALDQTRFDTQLGAIQQLRDLGLLTDAQYQAYLEAEKERLLSIEDRTYQETQMLLAIEVALKALNEGLVGQFNLGDIRVPTPYEVRRGIESVFDIDAAAAVADEVAQGMDLVIETLLHLFGPEGLGAILEILGIATPEGGLPDVPVEVIPPWSTGRPVDEGSEAFVDVFGGAADEFSTAVDAFVAAVEAFVAGEAPEEAAGDAVEYAVKTAMDAAPKVKTTVAPDLNNYLGIVELLGSQLPLAVNVVSLPEGATTAEQEEALGPPDLGGETPGIPPQPVPSAPSPSPQQPQVGWTNPMTDPNFTGNLTPHGGSISSALAYMESLIAQGVPTATAATMAGLEFWENPYHPLFGHPPGDPIYGTGASPVPDNPNANGGLGDIPGTPQPGGSGNPPGLVDSTISSQSTYTSVPSTTQYVTIQIDGADFARVVQHLDRVLALPQGSVRSVSSNRRVG